MQVGSPFGDVSFVRDGGGLYHESFSFLYHFIFGLNLFNASGLKP